MTISASIICDSISREGIRLTTFQLRYPRFIHAEFLTHRVFTRNSRSSRAVPVSKMIDEVLANPVEPAHWGKNQPGMQAHEELGPSAKANARYYWSRAAETAVEYAKKLNALGAHKQIVNRILEPFLHIDTLVTATEWDNWWGLRCHPDAQPEIRMLAGFMKAIYDDGRPGMRFPGEWHLPYVTMDDIMALPMDGKQWETAVKISVARCARVSYKAFDGTATKLDDDLALYDKLVTSKPMHLSPTEHQARPDHYCEFKGYIQPWWMESKLHGNFVGWCQYRKMLAGEANASAQ